MAVTLPFGEFTLVGEEIVYLARYLVDFLIYVSKELRLALYATVLMKWL